MAGLGEAPDTGAMREVEVREATVADATGLARVQTQSWREAYEGLVSARFLNAWHVAPQLWTGRLTQSGPQTATFVAVADSHVVGFAGVGPGLSPAGDSRLGQLYTLYLLAQWWGTGLGHRLHTAALDALTSAGYEHAVLWVLDGNSRASAFYQRHGWRFDGGCRIERMGDEPLRELRMSRRLEPEEERAELVGIHAR
jgi:GNAT superfamily N-acetyltransferase